MSTKNSILYSENIHFFEEIFDEKNVYIEATGSGNSEVEISFDKYQKVTITISNEQMDDIAIAWCKKRKLHKALTNEK
jgi:hypothetical protein